MLWRELPDHTKVRVASGLFFFILVLGILIIIEHELHRRGIYWRMPSVRGVLVVLVTAATLIGMLLRQWSL